MLTDLKEGCEPRCPGCTHRTLSAQQSQTQKEDWLKRRLAPWREALVPLQAIDDEGRWEYREKIRLSTAWNGDRWYFGLMARDELIPIPRCPVHAERARRIIELLSDALPPGPQFPMAFYVQAGAQATLVLKTQAFLDLAWCDSAFCEALAGIGLEGLWLHRHPAAGRRMFAKNGWHLLWGKPRSRDRNGFVYGPTAFQQLIPELYGRALDEAEAFLAPSAGAAIVDLYCGSGITLARWTAGGACAVGVELGGEAVECARENAPRSLVLRGKCAERIPQLDAWLTEASEARKLLYVNPPRTGLEPKVRAWIAGDFRPACMTYLSCSAGTLSRDLEILVAAGYRVERITPYDFFPQTHHVETLVLLRRIDQG